LVVEIQTKLNATTDSNLIAFAKKIGVEKEQETKENKN